MPKILIIRFSSIGDIVLTTPVVRCIKKQIPGAVVHYVTKKSFRGILENNPHIDQIFTIEKDIDEVADQLKKEDYDFIVDLHHNLRSTLLKRKLKKPSSAFPKLNIKKFLLTQFKINRLPELHVVDRYFEAVKPLKVHSDILVGDFIIPAADEVNINDFGIPDKFVAFAIGAQMTTKKLPNEKIAELLNKIKLPVVLLGGETDFDNSEIIMQKISARSEENKIINLCGRLNLNQSASVVRQSLKIITHDTGLMHIASCFRKPTVSIWGNTTPDFGMYPYMPMNPALYSIHEVKDLKCRPCSKIGYKECPKKHFNCMNQQNLDKIAREVNS